MTDKSASKPHLLAVAHGTHNGAGVQANEQLIDLVRALRPDLAVTLCWLDIATPSLLQALTALDTPTVVVPVLLSTGYHVKSDIPAAIRGRDQIVQAGHLGPDVRVVQAVLDRLIEAGGGRQAHIALVGSGSSDSEARRELAAAGQLLASLTGAEVSIGQLTEDDPLGGDRARGDVASYLLAPGYFAEKLHDLAGPRVASPPLGAHPLIADVILDRYDQAAQLLESAEPATSSR